MEITQCPQGRFLLFTLMEFYPKGGFKDLSFGFDTTEECLSKIETVIGTNLGMYDFFHILDTEKRVWYPFDNNEELKGNIVEVLRGSTKTELNSFTVSSDE